MNPPSQTEETLQKGENHPEYAPPHDGRRRWLRKRLAPATFLCLTSGLIQLGYLAAVGRYVYLNIRYRWIEPDLEWLDFLNQWILSPPVLAHCLLGISGSLCGTFAAFDWMRGRWRSAALRTFSFFLLMALAFYVISGMLQGLRK